MESKVVDHVTEAAAAAAKIRTRQQNRGGADSGGGSDDSISNFNWSFNPQRIFSRKMGSGNNWANGYYNYGPQCKEEIVEMVRKEVETCDSVDGFLLLMSLAGGTGSGLGTAVATILQDSFGGLTGKTSLCQAVWPHSSGEVILQNYNTLLSVAHLYQVSDALIVQFNDILHYICNKRLHLQKVNFSDMNRLIAHHLSSMLSPAWPIDLTPLRPPSKPRTFKPQQPKDDSSKRMDQCASPPKNAFPSISHSGEAENPCNWNGTKRPKNTFTEVAMQLTPHPGYRMLQSFSVPIMSPNCLDFSREHWTSLIKRLRQMLLTNTAVDEGLEWNINQQRRNRSLANCVYLRGVELDLSHVRDEYASDNTNGDCNNVNNNLYESSESAKRFSFKLLRDEEIYCPWVPADDRLRAFASPFPHGGYEKSATLLSNSSAIAGPLEAVTSKAWKMFSARAYLHQYQSFGLAQDDFLNCFASVEQIIKNYKEI